MRWSVGLCLVVVLVGGCGGSDDRPDLEAAPPATETAASTVDEPGSPSPSTATPTAPASSTPLPARQRGRITTQAADTAAAIERWNAALSLCIGASGGGDNASATCTQAAWEQLFDAMDVAQYELLRLVNRIAPGACHEALVSVLDAVHGFLAGATPTNVVWLDEQQQPPSRFDLEAIVDLVRPVPARMRDAAESTCRS
jgi:hypothetical protein